MIRAVAAFALLVPFTLAGCPQAAPDASAGGVAADIALSATQGPAPLRVTVSGTGSSSPGATIVGYRWDFAGQATSQSPTASHTFTSPGRYTITLTVVDDRGREGTARADVRVGGGSAVAVIQVSTASGPAPLSVRFDASASSAENDAILDYFWDFDDGGAARSAVFVHTFRAPGEYDVTLRVVTGGGSESVAHATIVVGAGGASLQFNGGQLATLPLADAGALAAFTIETWFKPDSDGGTILTLGAPEISVSAAPASNSVRVRIGTVSSDAPAFNLVGAWRHLALRYDASGDAALLLDGVRVASAATAGGVSIQQVILGGAYRGRIARTRLWNVARTDAEIAADLNRIIPAAEPALLGNWPLDAGSGQTLTNRAGGPGGTLGSTSSAETIDPAWSSDAP